MTRQKIAPRHPLARVALGIAAVALLGSAAACSSDESADPAVTTTTRPAEGPAPTAALADAPSTDEAFPDGLRGVRYCEVLLLNTTEDGNEADVWNTLGENDCPQADWDALDAAAIAEERGAVLALKNGPRYWTLDAIVSDIRAGAPTTTFGRLGMFRAATVSLGEELPSQTPYVGRSVVRETIFRFRAGAVVHELVDADGARYVMQSSAQTVDPTLTVEQLDGLGSRLELPDGWSFTSRRLEADLDVRSTDGVATVVQDDLQNTYQRIDEQGTTKP